MGVAVVNFLSNPLMGTTLTYRAIAHRAWPIILANAAVPLLGLVDTAVIGNTGNTQQLGAIALGALIFNFVYWSFGFLRMSTTGFTAQAAGANNSVQVRAILGRALMTALVISAVILLLQGWLGTAIFALLQASSEVEGLARDYFFIRLWGAPASLATFALLGTLVGLGKSGRLLAVQVFLNGTNAILDIIFAGWMGWGVQGIAYGTLIAEWATFILALCIVVQMLRKEWSDDTPFWNWNLIVDRQALVQMISANRDIMIRTLFLVLSFAWFTHKSATYGDTVLAANHILLQFVSFSAFFLDGYAFVAEAIVGTAIGAKRRQEFDLGIRRSSVLGLITSCVLALIFAVLGAQFIALLTDIESVRASAYTFLPLACVYIVVSVAAFQLDGIFIGAVRSADMRNAAIVSTILFIAASKLLESFGNVGLWWCFIVYVVLRAVSLLYYFPALRRSV